METRLVSIKEAAKLFNFPVAKLYRLVEQQEVPFITLQNLSGTQSRKINTRAFAEWLDELARTNQAI